MSPRTPVRIKVYGGSLNLLPPGTAWRIERITEYVQPTGVIGEVMPEWTIIDFQPIEREASSPALDVERLGEAYHRYRLQFPAGTLYCGADPDGPEYPPQPYEFGSATCSCTMDMVGTVQRMDRERLHTVTDSSGACTLPCPACQDIMLARLAHPDSDGDTR